MFRVVSRSRIYNAVVTGKQLYYQGSIGVDKAILLKSNIAANEKVQVLNHDNGERFETYIIEEKEDSGLIILYGPASRKAETGDIISIISYALEEDSRARLLKPRIVLLTDKNKIKS
jgi:aspartate 1-decarboxylase